MEEKEINYVICYWKSNFQYVVRVEDVLIHDIPFTAKCETKQELEQLLKSLQKEFKNSKIVELSY